MNVIDTNRIPNEIDKEEARNQFNVKTEELNLKHTFSFDEMWNTMVEKRLVKQKKDKFRKDIINFEDKIKNYSENLGEDPFPLAHTFSDGLYIRQVTVPAKTLTVTKVHKQEHVFFLQKGTISVLTEEGIKKYTAPFQGITKIGTKRIIYHHDEVIFTTVHATDKKTVEEVEDQVISNDFKEVDKIEKLNLDNFVSMITKGE